MKTIAQRVVDLRKARGLTQTALGQRINYSRTYISMIERGEQEKPDDEFIERIEALEGKARMHNRVQEMPEPYGSNFFAGETQSMAPPPHHIPRQNTPSSMRSAKSPHENYVEATRILDHLMENHPEALEALMLTLRGVYEMHKQKK